MTHFQNKQELQHYIESMLKALKVPYEHEKLCNADGLRADIVTSDAVIEVRTILNRTVLDQAIAQGKTYQRYLNKSRLLVIGQIPVDAQEGQRVRAIAKDVVRQLEVEVVFIEGDWFPAWNGGRQASRPVSTSVLHGRLQRQPTQLLLLHDWLVRDGLAVMFGMISLAIAWMIWVRHRI